MKKCSDPPPQCAFNPPALEGSNSLQHPARDDRNLHASRPTPGRNSFQHRYPPTQQQPKREPQQFPSSQPWPTPSYDNSNASWGEGGDWSGTPPMKPDPGAYYKPHPYPSGSEWSPGDSSASNSIGATGYGMGQSPASMGQSPSATSAGNAATAGGGGSYYENNGYYSSGYNNNYGTGYTQPTSYPPQPPYPHQQPPVRAMDSYHQQHNNTSNNRPSNCPPAVKQEPMPPDYQRRQNRYGTEAVPKVQIKQEPEEYQEMESDNFTSLFTKSLTSLYSQDTENEDGNDPDIMILPPPQPPPQPTHHTENQSAYQRLHSSENQSAYQRLHSSENQSAYQRLHSSENQSSYQRLHSSDNQSAYQRLHTSENQSAYQRLHSSENQAAYQRLHSSGGHYTTSGEYQENQNNFGFYETKILNCEPQGSIVQEIGSKGDRSNSFRYDRPSFDDMHLYAPNSTDSKAQVKKRKSSMPTAPTENSTENRKKASRGMSFKSESQWTPNSFGFDGIQIKQEPMDDYTNSNELESSTPFQDSSPGSSGNGNSKTAEQPKDHPKQPPRKRSPGRTCFDRFDKKSTPTSKKVSPLSLYAKVQDSMVLSVKCRRYKKRTKPISCKEEVLSPCIEEMDEYKRLSLTPDQAARLVMSDLVERVSLFGERNAIGRTDLTHMEPYQIRDLFMQFCHRSNLDYRDFEDTGSVLRPRIIEDTAAKNSERASAIRKRTSTSPVQATEPSPEENPTEPPVVKKTRRRRKANPEESPTFEKRVLRQLPGRAARNGACCSSPVVERRYSTRNGRGESDDVDIVIDLSTDQEEEAGKEAEVRKKSQRLKNKRPARKTPARDRSLEENEEPVAKATTPRGRNRSRQPVDKKPAREHSLDSTSTGKAREQSLDKDKSFVRDSSREQSLDKRRSTSRTSAREQSLDKAVPISGPSAREQSLDKARSTGRKSSREQSLDKATPTRMANAREQSLDKAIPSGGASARERSLDKATSTGRKSSREQSLDKATPTRKANAREQSLNKTEPIGRATRQQSLDNRRSTSRASTREQSLENVSKSTKPNNVEPFEDSRRRTRSREKKVQVPMEIYKPAPRKRRSRARRMSSNDSSVELVDITRSSNSASPPLLDAIKIEASASEVKPKNKNTKRGRKGKNAVAKDSPALMVAGEIKVEDVSDAEPPVLRRSVKRKRIKDAIQMEPPSLHLPAGTTKRRNSGKIEPPALFVSLETIKTKSEIKIKEEPISPTENNQNTKFETFNGAIASEVANYNLTSSINQKVFKPKFEEIPKSAPVKSGSSKRKQGGPTKFLKESFKTSTFPTFLESSNPNSNNLASDVEQSNNKFGNSNLLSKFSSSKLFNNITAAALPEPANSSESLRERYRKSFCTEPLRNTTPKRPEEKPARFNPFLKSKTSAPKPEHSVARPTSSRLFPSCFSGPMVKVKQEPLSEDEDAPTTTLNPSASTSARPAFTKIKMETNHKMDRRGSQCSDSELQVVLTKLPDVQVDLRNGSVADELVKKCEEEQERMDAGAKEQELSDFDSDEEKPLMLLRTFGFKQKKQSTSSASDCMNEQGPRGKNSTPAAIKPENRKTKRSVDRRRYSDSEDSDCGLVIDLDRRLSVEERVPSPTIQNSITDEDLTETEDMDPTRPEGPTPTSISDKPQTTPNDSDLPSAKVKDEQVSPAKVKEDQPVPEASLFRDATEEAHILLDLSRGGMPPLIEGAAGNWAMAGTAGGSCSVGENREVKVEVFVGENKEPERDESILRTLLLENGEGASGTLQDMEPFTSFESKHASNQEPMRLLPYPEFQATSSSSEIDEKKMMDELQQNCEQMSSDGNSNFLPASYEWCLRDPRAIREVIQKLKDEIRHLQRMAEKRDRERTAIVCFKRLSNVCRYKEEILKRLLKKCTTNMKDSSEWCEQKNSPSHLNGHQPIALTSSPSGMHSRLASALTGGAAINSEMPSATVTSNESYSSNSGENLPTVATMVANATENYGVDLRTVTSRRSVGSTNTILQEALSSKEPIYRPAATRSPNERPPDCVRVVQNSPLAAREPPFPSRKSHLSRRLLGRHGNSQSPQPEASFLPVAHSPFRNTSYDEASAETEATRARRVSPSPSRKSATPKSRSSRKSNSFSLWGQSEAEKNSSSSIDLRINPFSQSRTPDPIANHQRLTSIDPRAQHQPSPSIHPRSNHPRSSSLDPRAKNQPSASIDHRANHPRSSSLDPRAKNQPSASIDPRDNHPRSSSLDPRTNPFLSHRPSSVERSNHASSIDLRNSQVPPSRPASFDPRTNRMSPSRSNPVGPTNGHSSFMIVPPPTTLQSAFKERGQPRSRSEGRSSDRDAAMNGQMERIYERRNDEDPSPRFVPLAGPLMPIAPEFPKCSGCGISRGRYVCSGCERQLYCSAKCQSLRWAEHSKSCSSTHRKDNSKSYD